MTMMRVIIGALIALIVAITLLPMLVLLDLVGGGDGWGICPDGLSSCRTSYFSGLELAVGLMILLFMLMFVLRLALHGQRMIDSRSERGMYERPPPHSDSRFD
ncbi:MAG: hypothetical protein MUP76_11175 [Acidimicrobiia bacterium]|nr:hypothetical protein [Acidimicrobiia bacterium]